VQLELTRPDPILGYNPKLHSDLWLNCKLKNLLLEKSSVWKVDTSTSSSNVIGAPVLDEGLETLAEDNAVEPEYLNFGLTKEDATLLFEELPRVAAKRAELAESAPSQDKLLKASTEAAEKRDQLMRILDLRNASARGIQAENTRRVIEAFGRKKPDGGVDTGSTEVQGRQIYLLI